MRAVITDLGTLDAISPFNLATYLRSTGWEEVDRQQGRSTLWEASDLKGNAHELFLPLDQSFVDYGRRIGEALGALAARENRSQLEIYRDITSATFDLVRIRAQATGNGDGTLMLGNAVHLVQASRDLLLAAACAAVSPRAVYHTRKPTRAIDYVEKQRMGQTEQGSYVVTLVCSVPPALEPPEGGQLFELEEPYERRVTRILAESLKKLHEAAGDAVLTGKVDQFHAAVRAGVSANLCESLVSIAGGPDPHADVSVGVHWALSRPLVELAPVNVGFHRNEIPVIAEAARLFRETSPYDDFELVGPVTDLHRETPEAVGAVRVLADVDGQDRKVCIELQGEQYNLMCVAHEEGKLVICRGDLVKEGRSWVLKNPSGLQTLEIEG